MSPGQEPPQLLEQRLFYRGRKFDFEVNRLRLPNQAEGDWECIRHPGGALAVPVTPEGKLILVRQYRFAVQGRLLESEGMMLGKEGFHRRGDNKVYEHTQQSDQ